LGIDDEPVDLVPVAQHVGAVELVQVTGHHTVEPVAVRIDELDDGAAVAIGQAVHEGFELRAFGGLHRLFLVCATASCGRRHHHAEGV
jgi:hypothetical protein